MDGITLVEPFETVLKQPAIISWTDVATGSERRFGSLDHSATVSDVILRILIDCGTPSKLLMVLDIPNAFKRSRGKTRKILDVVLRTQGLKLHCEGSDLRQGYNGLESATGESNSRGSGVILIRAEMERPPELYAPAAGFGLQPPPKWTSPEHLCTMRSLSNCASIQISLAYRESSNVLLSTLAAQLSLNLMTAPAIDFDRTDKYRRHSAVIPWHLYPLEPPMPGSSLVEAQATEHPQDQDTTATTQPMNLGACSIVALPETVQTVDSDDSASESEVPAIAFQWTPAPQDLFHDIALLLQYTWTSASDAHILLAGHLACLGYHARNQAPRNFEAVSSNAMLYFAQQIALRRRSNHAKPIAFQDNHPLTDATAFTRQTNTETQVAYAQTWAVNNLPHNSDKLLISPMIELRMAAYDVQEAQTAGGSCLEKAWQGFEEKRAKYFAEAFFKFGGLL